MIRLKPYFLQERKVLISIIDYPLCTVEKNKISIEQTETNSVNYLKIWLNHFCTSLLPVSSSLLPVYFQFTSSLLPIYFQSTSSLLPVFIHLLGVYFCVKFLIFYKLLQIDTVWTNNDIDNPLCNVEKKMIKQTERKSVNYLKICLNGNLQL